MAFIYSLTDSWNDVTTTWNGIKLAVTNTSSDASSKLLNLTVSGATTASFVVDKSGNLELNGSVNKVTITAPATAATFTLANNSTFATVGAHSATFTFTGTTAVTFPTSGTVTALGNSSTGSGDIVLATSPTLVTPNLGTPSAVTLTNGTGLPVSTGISGFGTGVAAALGVNVGSSGAFVVYGGALGTPSSGDLSNCTGYTVGNISGLGSGVATWLGTPSSANLRAAVTDETGTGSLVFATSPSLVTPDLGTPSAATLTNATGLPISTGVSGLGANVATFLATPSSANLRAAVTDETGTGSLVFSNSPTFNDDITLGVPSTTRGELVLANTTANTVKLRSSNSTAADYTLTFPAAAPVNGYYLQTDTNGVLSWAAGGGGGGGSPGGSNTQIQFNNAGAFGGDAAFTFVNGGATATISLGVASTTSGVAKLYNSSSASAITIASGNNSAAWTLTLPTSAGTNGYLLQTDGSGNTSWVTPPATGLTVGSTSIASGTSGRILYDNAGALGEKAVTGTGDVVLATSPTLVTPTLGVAAATSINKVAITAPATGSTLTIADGKTLTASNTLTFTGTDSSSVAFGAGGTVLYNGGALGTPSSGTLTSCTGLPISTGVSGLGANVATFLATPSSANLAAAVTDETGSGALVFGTSPTFTTSALFPDGSVSAPSIAHAGDTNCGFYFGTDTIYAATSGTNALTVDSSQNTTVANTLVMGSSFLRNRIINGSYRVDQRNSYASQTITAAAALAYTADRWYAYCTGANVTGQDVAGTGSDQRAYKFTGATSNTLVGFGQRIEQLNSYDLSDKAVTISAFMTASTNTTITWYLYTPTTSSDTFGTIASPSVTQVATGTFSVTTTKTRFSATISAAAMAGVNKGLELRFVAASGLGNAVTWTIENVQLEEGTIATSFERRLYGLELLLCQRYYTAFDFATKCCIGQAYTSGAAIAKLADLPVKMRATPSATITAGDFAPYNSGGSTQAAFTSVSNTLTTMMWGIDISGSSGLSAGNAAVINKTGSNPLALSAEL